MIFSTYDSEFKGFFFIRESIQDEKVVSKIPHSFSMNTLFAIRRWSVSQFHVSSIAILLTYGDLLQQSNLVEANYLKIVQVYHPEFT